MGPLQLTQGASLEDPSFSTEPTGRLFALWGLRPLPSLPQAPTASSVRW